MDAFLDFYNSGRYTFAGYQCFRDDMRKSFNAGHESRDGEVLELRALIESLTLELMYKNGQISRLGGSVSEYQAYIDNTNTRNS